jgi:hypothetical protein
MLGLLHTRIGRGGCNSHGMERYVYKELIWLTGTKRNIHKIYSPRVGARYFNDVTRTTLEFGWPVRINHFHAMDYSSFH